MKMNNQWEKEWQEINVPQKAVFQAIEKGLGADQKKSVESSQRRKVTKIRSFIKKNHRLLAVAATLLLLASAGIASINSNRQMKFNSSESQHQSAPQADKAVESPAATPKVDEATGQQEVETKGKVEFSTNEAGGDAATEASPEAKKSAASTQKLIKTYDIAKETNDFSQTIERIEKTVKTYDGYVSQSDITNQESDDLLRRASYTFRIPQAKVEEFVTALAKIGETISSSENATDYSLSYADNDSRITALQTEEDALLKLLEKSDNVQDMIYIQDRLSQVRSSKESLIQQNKLIDSQVAETEVRLSVNEVKKITKEESTTILTKTKDNWHDQLKFWQQLGQQLAVFFLSVGPYLVAIIGVLGVIWCVNKKRRV